MDGRTTVTLGPETMEERRKILDAPLCLPLWSVSVPRSGQLKRVTNLATPATPTHLERHRHGPACRGISPTATTVWVGGIAASVGGSPTVKVRLTTSWHAAQLSYTHHLLRPWYAFPVDGATSGPTNANTTTIFPLLIGLVAQG